MVVLARLHEHVELAAVEVLEEAQRRGQHHEVPEQDADREQHRDRDQQRRATASCSGTERRQQEAVELVQITGSASTSANISATPIVVLNGSPMPSVTGFSPLGAEGEPRESCAQPWLTPCECCTRRAARAAAGPRERSHHDAQLLPDVASSAAHCMSLRAARSLLSPASASGGRAAC